MGEGKRNPHGTRLFPLGQPVFSFALAARFLRLSAPGSMVNPTQAKPRGPGAPPGLILSPSQAQPFRLPGAWPRLFFCPEAVLGGDPWGMKSSLIFL